MTGSANKTKEFPYLKEEVVSFGHVFGETFKSIEDDWNFNT